MMEMFPMDGDLHERDAPLPPKSSRQRKGDEGWILPTPLSQACSHLSPLSLLKAQAKATTWEVARLMTGTQSKEVTSQPNMLLSCLCSSCGEIRCPWDTEGGTMSPGCSGVGGEVPIQGKGTGTHLTDVLQGDGLLVLHHLSQAPEGKLWVEGMGEPMASTAHPPPTPHHPSPNSPKS